MATSWHSNKIVNPILDGEDPAFWMSSAIKSPKSPHLPSTGLQQDLGVKAEVIIDSGDVPQLLNRAAERTKADVLVIGRIPGRSHLGDNEEGYGIIRESHIPVLSV